LGLFLGGTLLAEIQFLRRDLFPEPSLALNDSVIPSPSRGRRFLKHLQKYLQHLLTICLFFMGLFLISFPDIRSESSPGYIQIHSWTPNPYLTFYLIQKFWDTLGSLLVLTAISFSAPIGSAHDSTPLLQIPFNTRLANTWETFHSHCICSTVLSSTVLAGQCWWPQETLQRLTGGNLRSTIQWC
jgi:hypothetical protein